MLLSLRLLLFFLIARPPSSYPNTCNAAPRNHPGILGRGLPSEIAEHHIGAIDCYSLPYGGIGTISHVFTIYTIVMLYYCRSPWMFMRINDLKIRNLLIVVVSFVMTVTMSSMAMVKCKKSWQYVVIACWMLTTSLIQTWVALAANLSAPARPTFTKIEYLSIPGALAGYPALFSIVTAFWDLKGVQMSSAVFITAVILLSAFLACCQWKAPSASLYTLFWLNGIGIVGLLYNDWVLATIKGNYLGTPRKVDEAIFWSYFAAKRVLSATY